jgi:hypothetical protein
VLGFTQDTIRAFVCKQESSILLQGDDTERYGVHDGLKVLLARVPHIFVSALEIKVTTLQLRMAGQATRKQTRDKESKPGKSDPNLPFGFAGERSEAFAQAGTEKRRGSDCPTRGTGTN